MYAAWNMCTRDRGWAVETQLNMFFCYAYKPICPKAHLDAVIFFNLCMHRLSQLYCAIIIMRKSCIGEDNGICSLCL